VRRGPDRGHTAVARTPILDLLKSPFCLAPWGALVIAIVFRAIRKPRGFAEECSRCGRGFCRFCKRFGGPASLCGRCVRLYARRDEVAAQQRDDDRSEIDSRLQRRRGLVRLVSLVAPGVHRFFAHRPFLAATTLFFFFLTLLLAIGGPWVFELRPLAPSREILPGHLVLGLAALLIWSFANVGAWRKSRES
jgi:hypothetical protein